MERTVLIIGEPLVELSSDGPFTQVNQFAKGYGGDALITAVALARFFESAPHDKRVTVELLTGLADDAFADDIQQLCRQQGVGLNHSTVIEGTNTGLYMVASPASGMTVATTHSGLRAASQRVAYYRTGSAASKLSPKHLPKNLLEGVSVVLASGIGLGISASMRSVIQQVFTEARAKGITTVLDPNYRPALWANADEAREALKVMLPLVDVTLPSMPDDTDALLGLEDPYRCIDMLQVYGTKLVALKAGKSGCYLGFRRQAHHVPAIEVRGGVKNTVGAGDVFNAGFIAGMLEQQPLVRCAQWANTYAGLKCQQTHTIRGIPSREAFERQIALLV